MKDPVVWVNGKWSRYMAGRWPSVWFNVSRDPTFLLKHIVWPLTTYLTFHLERRILKLKLSFRIIVLYSSTQMTIINHEYCYHKGYDVTGPFFKVADWYSDPRVWTRACQQSNNGYLAKYNWPSCNRTICIKTQPHWVSTACSCELERNC